MPNPNDQTTMTINEQKRILRDHVLAFLNHQRKATIALRAINEIGLLENEGNPLPRMIQGEAMLRHWTTINSLGLSPAFNEHGEFSDVIDDIQQAINANGYIV
jgi:hypothetical protein